MSTTVSVPTRLQVTALLGDLTGVNTTYADETQDYRGCSWLKEDGQLHFGVEENGCFGRRRVIREDADTVTRSRESFVEVADYLDAFRKEGVSDADLLALRETNWAQIRGTFRKLTNNYKAKKQKKALEKISKLAKSLDALQRLVVVDAAAFQGIETPSAGQVHTLLTSFSAVDDAYTDEGIDLRGCAWILDGQMHFATERNGTWGRAGMGVDTGAAVVVRSRNSFVMTAEYLDAFIDRGFSVVERDHLSTIDWAKVTTAIRKLTNNYHAHRQYKALKKILLLAKAIDRLRRLVRIEEETLEAIAGKSALCRLATKNVVLVKVKEQETGPSIFRRAWHPTPRGFNSLPCGRVGCFQRERAVGLKLRLGATLKFEMEDDPKEDLCVKIMEDVQLRSPEVCRLVWDLETPEEKNAEIFAVTFEPCMRNVYAAGMSVSDAVRAFSNNVEYPRRTLPKMFAEAQIETYYKKVDELKTALRAQVKANAYLIEHFPVDKIDDFHVDAIINDMLQRANSENLPITEVNLIAQMNAALSAYHTKVFSHQAQIKLHIMENFFPILTHFGISLADEDALANAIREEAYLLAFQSNAEINENNLINACIHVCTRRILDHNPGVDLDDLEARFAALNDSIDAFTHDPDFVKLIIQVEVIVIKTPPGIMTRDIAREHLFTLFKKAIKEYTYELRLKKLTKKYCEELLEKGASLQTCLDIFTDLKWKDPVILKDQRQHILLLGQDFIKEKYKEDYVVALAGVATNTDYKLPYNQDFTKWLNLATLRRFDLVLLDKSLTDPEEANVFFTTLHKTYLFYLFNKELPLNAIIQKLTVENGVFDEATIRAFHAEYTDSIALFREHVADTLLTDDMLQTLDPTGENINVAFRDRIIKLVIAEGSVPSQLPTSENLITACKFKLKMKLIKRDSHLTPQTLLGVFPLDTGVLTSVDFYTTAHTYVVDVVMSEATDLDFGMYCPIKGHRELALAVLQQGKFLDEYGALVKTVHFDADWATVSNANLTPGHRVPEGDTFFKEKVFALTLLEFLRGAIPGDWNATDPRRLFLEREFTRMQDEVNIGELSKDSLDWLMQGLLGHYLQMFPQRVTPCEVREYDKSLTRQTRELMDIQSDLMMAGMDAAPESEEATKALADKKAAKALIVTTLEDPGELIELVNSDIVGGEGAPGRDVRCLAGLLLDSDFSNRRKRKLLLSRRRADEVSFAEFIFNSRSQTHKDLIRSQYRVKKSNGAIVDFGNKAGSDKYEEFCEVFREEFAEDPDFVRTAFLLINQASTTTLTKQCTARFGHTAFGINITSGGFTEADSGISFSVDFETKKVVITMNLYLQKSRNPTLTLARLPVKIEYSATGNGTLIQELLEVELMPDFQEWKDLDVTLKV